MYVDIYNIHSGEPIVSLEHDLQLVACHMDCPSLKKFCSLKSFPIEVRDRGDGLNLNGRSTFESLGFPGNA